MPQPHKAINVALPEVLRRKVHAIARRENTDPASVIVRAVKRDIDDAKNGARKKSSK